MLEWIYDEDIELKQRIEIEGELTQRNNIRSNKKPITRVSCSALIVPIRPTNPMSRDSLFTKE